MPMIDAFIPNGALDSSAEARLMEELTEILIRHEGLDPSNERVRSVTWIFVHRPTVYLAGSAAPRPVYRITPTVPEGQYTDEARAGVVREVTEAIARAEGKSFAETAPRVWVFPTEVFDGGWGSRGVIRRLPEIMAFFNPELAAAGQQRLSSKRRGDIVAFLEAALDMAKRAG
jgi:phenylpyruvate tautomerase PptA (4-oxalocrotonate tautomerase family)